MKYNIKRTYHHKKQIHSSMQIHFQMKVTIEPLLHGVHWFMHEHDEDINKPSCPHCHAKEKNWKMDIYTGRIYDYSQGGSYIGKLTKSEMRKLWGQKGFRDLVEKERRWYEENYHLKNPQRYPFLPAMPVGLKLCKHFVVLNLRRLHKFWMK